MDIGKRLDDIAELAGEGKTRARAALRIGARVVLDYLIQHDPYDAKIKACIKSLDAPTTPEALSQLAEYENA